MTTPRAVRGLGRDVRALVAGSVVLLALLAPCLAMAQAPAPTSAGGQPPDPLAPQPINVAPPKVVTPYLPFSTLPAVQLDETNNGVGIAQQTARARKLQARIMWIDATANMNRMNTAEKVQATVDKIKQAGFNMIVLDVKPIVGYTLYPSKLAHKLNKWLDDRAIPPDFDPVAEFVTRAHAAGLQLVASMCAFSEGHRIVHEGPGYEHPEWQTTLYEPQMQVHGSAQGVTPFPITDRSNVPARNSQELALYSDAGELKAPIGSVVSVVAQDGTVLAQVAGDAFPALVKKLPSGAGALVGDGPGADFLRQNARVGDKLTFETAPTFVPISQRPEQQVPLMTNPNDPAVRQRMLDIVSELVRGYQVDGVIFDDRLRYAGINADFGEESRKQFEAYVGHAVKWPDDVFRYDVTFPELDRHVVPGPLYESWLVWRAMTLRNWLASAVTAVKAIRPTCTVSTYTGSWFGEYPLFGANWSADDFTAGFRFLTPSYQQTGWAELLDWMTTGCYYPTPTVLDAFAAGKIPGASVEAAGQLTNRAANDQTWSYAGIGLSDYIGHPEQLKAALQAACASTQGVMVFDLSHFQYAHEDADKYWQIFADAFHDPATPPHAVAGLLAQIRKDHLAQKTAGPPLPPVVIYGGIPGTGF